MAFFLVFFVCAQGWCNFPEHVEHQWNDLEQVLCKKKSVAVYIADSKNDSDFISGLQHAVFEIFGEKPTTDLDHKDQEFDLTLAIIISRKEEHDVYVTLFMAGEDYEEEEKPYFLDCFQTPKEKILDETVMRLRHRIVEISECGGSLKPYMVLSDEDQF
jgi:hypothetical protein